MTETADTIVLGGGMTGLAAGYASGLPVYEASDYPGGICSSYYVRPGTTKRLAEAPADGEAYRFEIGGGHWIFGGDPVVLRCIDSLAPTESYRRRSSVFFHEQRCYVPYPLQNNLRCLDRQTATTALAEMLQPSTRPTRTMEDWLLAHFGKTLCDLFFMPFHELYTAGCHREIAPQDAYKSPVDLAQAVKGALAQADSAGYNVTFVYPQAGLNALARRLAAAGRVHYGMKALEIDRAARVVTFANGHEVHYRQLISTLPLNKTVAMAGLNIEARADAYTSVLVLNIGAERGENCPDDHWTYNANTRSRFHRVGIYSNVTDQFLPASRRGRKSHVSIYVERAYPGGLAPSEADVDQYAKDVVKELQEWGYIAGAEVVDPTWIDVAYTWTWPGSAWVGDATRALQSNHIYPVGRYARWIFQGIADSIRDGFMAGAGFRHAVVAKGQQGPQQRE